MTPLAIEKVLPGIPEDPSPTIVVAKVLGNLEPREEVVESPEASKEDE